MKTAAVIGASSMLGIEISGQLQADGVRVFSVGRGSGNNVAVDLDRPLGDLPQGLPSVDVVFHCAAAFADESAAGLWANCMTNTMGSLNALALMRHMQCRVCVYAGSIFSNLGVETTARTGYGLSKSLGEQILAWGLIEGDAGGVFCSIRLPQLYDVDGRCCQHQAWFGRIVAYASRGLDLNMPASGGQRNFVHVHDAARLMIQAARNKLTGAWEASHPQSLDYLQIAELAYEAFGLGGQARVAPAKMPFRPLSYPSGEALFNRLGISPAITMAEGLRMIREAGSARAFGPMDVQ